MKEIVNCKTQNNFTDYFAQLFCTFQMYCSKIGGSGSSTLQSTLLEIFLNINFTNFISIFIFLDMQQTLIF